MHPRLVFLLFYVSATAALVHFDLRSLEPFKTDSRYGSILLKVIDCAAWRESIAAVLPRARIFCFDELNLSKKAGMVDGTTVDLAILERSSNLFLNEMFSFDRYVRESIIVFSSNQTNTDVLLDDWLRHRPFWFVSHDALSTTSTPSYVTLKTVDLATRYILQAIRDLHAIPKDQCSSAQYFILGDWNSGFGASIHTIADGLQVALLSKRIFIVLPMPDWIYGDPADCGALMSPECFFLVAHETPCFGFAISAWAELNTTARRASEALSPGAQFWSYMSPHRGHPFRPPYMKMASWELNNPYVWSLMARPKREVRQYVRTIRSKSKLQEPYDGLHVRHGDKWMEARLIPFKTYLDALDSSHPVHSVWLATDDVNVIKECTDVKEHTFFHNAHAIASIGTVNMTIGNFYDQRASKAGSRTMFFYDTYADIDILVHSNIFVGMRSSGMSQIVATMKSFLDSPASLLL